MSLLPRVLLLAAMVGVSAYPTSSASAQDRAAVLVCDVTDPAGPNARALDLSRSSGSGGIAGFGDFGQFGEFDDFDDIDDRSCADIIAALVDDGFRIEEFLAVGDDSVAIFALGNND